MAALLLTVPLLMWGLAPGLLATLTGRAQPGEYASLLEIVAHARRSVWIGLALSGVGGVGLGLLRRQIFASLQGWQQLIGAVASLEWLYRVLAGLLALLGGGLRYFAVLGEGEGYVGWLALAGLALWVLLRG